MFLRRDSQLGVITMLNERSQSRRYGFEVDSFLLVFVNRRLGSPESILDLSCLLLLKCTFLPKILVLSFLVQFPQ